MTRVWFALPVLALAGAALLAQPPEEDARRLPQPAVSAAPTPAPPAPPAGPSLAVCRTKVLTPPEKAYCCATYPQLRRACS